MCLAAWNCFYNPYVLAYTPEFAKDGTALAVNTFIDMFFVVDIALTFRTSFFSSVTGDEIIDPNLIAKNYIMGKLWIDILSCFPSDIFASFLEDDSHLNYTSLIGLFGLLKVYRISRLNRIVAFMRAKNDVKSVLRIG